MTASSPRQSVGPPDAADLEAGGRGHDESATRRCRPRRGCPRPRRPRGSTWRSAWTTRPRLPMRRPMSPLSACTRIETSSRRSIISTSTASGMVGDGARHVLDDGLGRATDDAVALGRRPRRRRPVVVVVVVVVIAHLSPRPRCVVGRVAGARVLGRLGGLGRGRAAASRLLLPWPRRPPARPRPSPRPRAASAVGLGLGLRGSGRGLTLRAAVRDAHGQGLASCGPIRRSPRSRH